MCGIIGYIGDEKVSKILLNGLRRLEYRGYDSCGIGVADNSRIIIKKNVGKVEEVAEKEGFLEVEGHIGVSHNRWATHGNVSKENAHPHTDCKNELCVVHNGIISNYKELKDMLIKKGHKFKSQTDTEVIPHLIEEELKKQTIDVTLPGTKFHIGDIHPLTGIVSQLEDLMIGMGYSVMEAQKLKKIYIILKS